VKRVDLADLSTGVLDHAVYFRDTNKDVIKNPRVTVYVNDGRQHLRMQPEATYDVIALEPPPITHAGVGALYSTEFYQLARTRLKPGGYISQWLPAYQMPPDITLAMVRAFLDAFPQAVLLSGADAELLLIGANSPRIEIDPARLVSRLADTPDVQSDLARINMGTVRELVGTFVGGPDTLDDATRGVPPVTDDRPLQEYGVRSLLTAVRNGVPASLFDLNQVAGWCPACFIGKTPAPVAEGLDTYLSLVGASYKQGPAGIPGLPDARARRMIQDSPYLQRVLPVAHLLLGLALASEGRLGEAVVEYRKEIELEPRSGAAHLSLGRALVAMGSIDAGIAELQIAAQIEPNDPQTLDTLATALLDAKQYDAAVNVLSVQARLMPDSPEVRNKLALALEAQRRAGAAR
jgi:tetratricopeptide (TPR) repeat protein